MHHSPNYIQLSFFSSNNFLKDIIFSQIQLHVVTHFINCYNYLTRNKLRVLFFLKVIEFEAK